MRLIDADAVLNFERFDLEVTGEEHTANDILMMIQTAPTIDPVHAAGGCYCRECRHKDTNVCPAFDGPMRRTSLRIKHCSEGEPKEAQDA